VLRKRGALVNAHACCTPRSEGRATTLRRGLWSSTCLLPAALVALAPKCPVCLAAYLTLVSGVGISTTAAAHVRAGGMALATAGATLLAWKLLQYGAAHLAEFGRRKVPHEK
jgi:hypothetical protein